MVQKIALEEHFLSPGLVDYWKPTMTEVAPPVVEQLFKRLTDFGDLRRIEQGVRDLNWGEVTVITPDGTPVR